jgi:superfamily II RNA helicase
MSAQTAPKQDNPPQTDVAESWDSDGSSESDEESSVSDDKTEDSDVDSDVDPEATSDEDKVLHLYKRLLSRRVDLVGDYAGNELFMIEGDSLLLRCFDDANLDFNPGFQLLHAAYNAEHFLHNLASRKCNFHITFFECNRKLCIPETTDAKDASKYLLAREAIIRHLQANLASSHPEIKVNVFDSYEAQAFSDYLQRTSLYFMMTHDGASPIDRKGKHIGQDTQAVSHTQRLPLRRMLLSFLARGYNVALINGLEWMDTKIMTMVLETRNRSFLNELPSAGQFISTSSRESASVPAHVEKLADPAIGLTERQALIAAIVSTLINSPPSSIDATTCAQLCCVLLLHSALLTHLPLASRRLEDQTGSKETIEFLQSVTQHGASILRSDKWSALTGFSGSCDVADAIDGRLFLQLVQQPNAPSEEVMETFNKLFKAAESLIGKTLPKQMPKASDVEKKPAAKESESANLSVLPFSNPVFDKHMESVHLEVDEMAGSEQTISSHKIFREVTHWHNAKKPIIQKPKEPTAVVAKQEFWAKKRNQMFMAEMARYSASLTGATGRSLDPETIIVGSSLQSKNEAADKEKAPSKGKTLAKKAATQSPADSDQSDSSAAKGKPGQKKGGGKNNVKNAAKQAMMDKIAADQAKKGESAGGKIVQAWATVCKNFDADKDSRMRYKKAKDYLLTVRREWREVIEAEVRLYMVSSLVQYWVDACRRKEQDRRVEVLPLIWDTATAVLRSDGLTKTILSNVELTVKTLQLPPVPETSNADSLPDRKLVFQFALPAKADSMAVSSEPKEFQLMHCGPYLERSFDSKPDNRVEFQPDGWQRRVLDGIDANKSMFVVAPTSAGKTFISFYAMRKILDADDDGVLVYVAPTKALVNQIAAEVQARYSKSYKYGGKSVWAIHTRDYRINNPQGCQILVTVPHVLQILLLSPAFASSWSPRVKRIIFDEVHSIGQAEDGVVWEQLLLMAPCPIIALSATVGNPQDFAQWLTSTQEAIGNKLEMVKHPHRYSDLRKHYYVAPKRFGFRGLPEKSAFGTLGLEGLKEFGYIHPVAALVDKSRSIPEDLGLEARDCLFLWQAMIKHQTDGYKVPEKLNPAKALPELMRKADVLAWEAELKELLRNWITDDASPYDNVLHELEGGFRNIEQPELQVTSEQGSSSDIISVEDDVLKSTLPMLCRLHEQDALPAILFNYDRHMCEKICTTIVKQLTDAEEAQVKSGPKWAKKLEQWEQWKKVQLKNAKNAKSAKASKKSKGDEDGEEGPGSKLDQQRDAGGADASEWDNFDPDAPQTGYHFADLAKVQRSEMEIYVKQLGRRNVAPWLIDALARGVGVHHAGMNRKYRQVCEILFRKGFLRVVIATGTLALGINMPCKTVVFSGDSVFLTALNYRQCAGRAGRRGFDLLGNVVFQGLSREKVCRLLSSRLPDLNGHFPITTTLVLRLFTLLHESKNAKYAVSAINGLLSQPRLYLGGASFKDQTMHHLRFSIEYLRRQYLLDERGQTLNFAGLVSHLYFTENSSFAFHALLKEGYFHELCSNVNKSEKNTVETLMLVMAHLFNRIPCRQADPEFREKVVKPSSSLVFLPPMPEKATQILRDHNQQTLDVYKTYVETFVNEHVKHDDRKLPLTGVLAGGEDRTSDESIESLPTPRIRSAFKALSGAGDDFATIHDLCQSTRDGVFLEEAVIPHLDIYPDEMEIPLNAWLLDFFKHGDVNTLEKANGIRKADIWFLLNDFSLALATIITSLLNFMKLREGTDVDMLDVMGNLDATEEAEDTRVADAEDSQSEAGSFATSAADSAISGMPERPKPVTSAKKAKAADSWEELADEETAGIELSARKAADAARFAEAEANEGGPAWEKEEGLKNVLKALQLLHAEFTVKFKAMWA